MNSLESINPATGRKIASYPEMSEAEVESILAKNRAAFEMWRRVSLKERAGRLRAAGQVLLRRLPELVLLMATEMGKPLKQGRAEIEKCAFACEFFSQNPGSFFGAEPVTTESHRNQIIFSPLGALLAVMPWNFPFWQVFRCALPALLGGNAIVLKHASNVSGCALAIEKLFAEAGLPENLFRTVLVRSGRVADLIAHRGIQAVTVTGSTEAGRSIAAKAGSALKKVVLELGGSDPYLILEDADLEPAAAACAASRLINSGQSCIAAKRFVVVASALPEFQRRFIEKMAEARFGDPLDENTIYGPLARADLKTALEQQVSRSLAQGATLLFRGGVPPGDAFFPATVLGNVNRAVPAYHEELFGPVASIISVRDEREAIAVANDSSFGLGAAVFTRDRARGEAIAREELEAGACFVNDFVRSDPRLPFGGVKESGFGRELSAFGAREFVNIKTVSVK